MQVIPKVSSKLTAPTLSGTIRREHLLKYLDASTQPLVWINAPGGAGKTTLLADWVDTRQLEHIWLRLDASDSSPGTFFHHLILAVQQAYHELSLNLPRFTQEYSLDPVKFASNFFESLAGINAANKKILVLDDYHEIDKSSPTHAIISEAIKVKEPSLQVFVLSRESIPPEYIHIKKNGKLNGIEWSDIRFNIDDTNRLIKDKLGFEITEKDLSEIYSITEGWAAGIRLLTANLSEQKTSTPAIPKYEMSHRFLHQGSFDFFAHEIMQSLSEGKKDFILKTSLMPYFTSDMARELTGASDSETVISFLIDSNLFIETHSGKEKTFSYHPLFRQYLNNCFKKNADPEYFIYISKKSADLLARMGAYEEAIDLYLKINIFEEALTLIKQKSEELISQGRIQQLSTWFELIPEDFQNSDLDLLYIYGKSLLVSSTEKSCSMLLKAKNGYIADNNHKMALQSYGSYLEALAISGKDYHLLEDCLYELENLLESSPTDLQPVAESIASTVLFSTSFQTLKHPLQDRWRRYAASALENCSDPVALLKNCNNMMIYYRFAGEDRSTYHLMEILAPIRQKLSSIPLLKLQTQLIYAFHYGYVCANGKEAEDICRASIEEGSKNGIRLYEFWFRYILVLSLLRDNRFESAHDQIKELLNLYTILPPVRRADILTLSGLHALYKEDFHQAIHDLLKARNMYSEAGASYPTHWSSIILSLSYLENEDHDSCKDIIYNSCSSDWLGSLYLEYQSLCVEAWLEHKEGILGAEKLKNAFSLAHRQNFVFIPLVGRKIFTKLCELALLQNIEPEYARKIIEEHALVPEDNSYLKHLWPCSIRIFTLKPFEVISATSESDRKIDLQQKPLALIKCIIAHGGYDVPIDSICDTLWQDSDGDAAYKSLKTTLYRLRKSLGGDHYIITHNNTLSLSDKCWVDALSVLNSPRHIHHGNIKAAQSLATLYQTPFLDEDRNEPWTFLTKERVRKRHKNLLWNIAHYFLEKGQAEVAASYLEQAIELDVLEEDYHIALMTCYQQQGRPDRVKAAYKRYGEACRILGEEAPSARLEDSYRKLIQS